MVKQKIPKIFIGLPSNGMIRAETVVSLFEMLISTPNVEHSLYTPLSCYIHMNREETVKRAIMTRSDYILFVDADMKFPPDTLIKLLAMDKDIVGTVYNQRKVPPVSVVIQLDPPLDKLPDHPFKVRAVGTGMLLIKTEVFKKMDRPWFFFEPELNGSAAIGEDVYFCDKARSIGYDIWVEPSIVMGHIGDVIF